MPGPAERPAAERRATLAGIVLAAGGGRRFGRPKALVPFDGEPLVVRALQVLAGTCPAGVIVVTGADGDAVWQAISEVAAAMRRFAVRRARNPDWSEGLGNSVAAGVRAVPEGAEAALLLPCDLVAVSAADLDRLATAWAADPQRIVAAGFDGRCGAPAILPRRTWPQVSALRGDAGARDIIAADGSRVVVAMPSAAQDVDTPDDLRRIAAGRMLE